MLSHGSALESIVRRGITSSRLDNIDMARPPCFTLLIIGADVDGLAQLCERLTAAHSHAQSVGIRDARDIREALAIIADTVVDVVLLDRPPGDDEANAAIRKLRQAAPHVPIVIATDA